MNSPPNLQDAAIRESALDVTRSFLVRAPAGSGKTELLTQRVLACLATCRRPEEVLVLTFTNKAVNEARDRILGALSLARLDTPPTSAHKQRTWALARRVLAHDQELGWDLPVNPNRLRIMTIDKLNGELAAQLPVLSGFGGAARIDDRPDRLYRLAVQNLFDELEDSSLDPYSRASLEAVLAFAENRQNRVSPLLVDMLRRRDQWLGVINHRDSFDMEHVLSSLITNRMQRAVAVTRPILDRLAAILLQASVAPLLAWASSLSSKCVLAEASNLGIWQSVAGALLTKGGDLRRRVNKSDGFPAGEPQTAAMNGLLTELLAWPDVNVLADCLADVRSLPDPIYPKAMDRFRGTLSHLLNRLVAHLRLVFEASGTVDFTEVGLRAIAAVGGSGGDITETLLRQDYTIRHVLLDEAQDTSASQYQLLACLIQGWQTGDGRTLFIVGDDQQSIYSFRQAEVGLFLNLFEVGSFAGLVLDRLSLSANFRSDPEVVDWFNSAFDSIFPKSPDIYASVVTFTPSTATKMSTGGSGVSMHAFKDADSGGEAGRVVEIIREVQSRHASDSIAVLVRTRSQLRAIIPALKKAGIQYTSQDIDPLAASPAVNDVLCLVRALWHPRDRASWIGLLRAPFVGLSWADVMELVKGYLEAPIPVRLQDAGAVDRLSAEGQKRVARLNIVLGLAENDGRMLGSLPARSEGVWHALGGPASVTPSEARDVGTFFELLRDHCRGGELTSLEELMDAVGGLYASAEIGQVQVMTIHKAKGLEFDTVILPGLGRAARRDDQPILYHRGVPGGYLIAPHPGKHAKADGPEKRLYAYLGRLESVARHNESLRLLYVGITRARSRLHLLGTVATADDGKASLPMSGSLLSHLWPVVESSFANATSVSATGAGTTRVGTPRAPRLPVDWAYPPIEGEYVPAQDRAELPSEMSIHGSRYVEECDGEEVRDRIVGVLFHAVMERVAREGLAVWTIDRLNSLADPLAAGCRRYGMPEAHVDWAVSRMLQLTSATLSDERGRWILSDHKDAANELALSGFVEGLWTSAVIDRTFIDETGTLWVVDYKSTFMETENVDEYLRDETLRYASQVRRYAYLRRRETGHVDVRAGLYFPSYQRFIEVTV